MRLGANARMFRSSRASKKSSGRAGSADHGGRPTATHVPLCLPKSQKTSDAPPECPMLGSRRLASPPGVASSHAQAQAAHRSRDGGPSPGGFRRGDHAGLGRAAHAARHARRRRAGDRDGRRAARHADRPDPDPGRQRADRQRPGHHARAAARAAAGPRRRSRRSRCRSIPTAARAAGSGAARRARRPRPRPRAATAAEGQPSAGTNSAAKPTQEPQAGQQAQQVTTGKLRQGSSSGRGCQEGQGRRREEGQGRGRQGAGGRRAAPARRPADAGNPTFSEALPGPAPIGVPNFFIDKFRIPPFLLPIYQAAGIEYGVPLAGPRRDQRDRDRLRAQPERLHRRRASAGCSSCPRRGSATASTPTATASRTRTTRSTRSSPPRAT